jgi:hypothetical protein
MKCKAIIERKNSLPTRFYRFFTFIKMWTFSLQDIGTKKKLKTIFISWTVSLDFWLLLLIKEEMTLFKKLRVVFPFHYSFNVFIIQHFKECQKGWNHSVGMWKWNFFWIRLSSQIHNRERRNVLTQLATHFMGLWSHFQRQITLCTH